MIEAGLRAFLDGPSLPGLFVVLAALGGVTVMRRWGRRLLAVALAGLVAMSLPVTAKLFLWPVLPGFAPAPGASQEDPNLPAFDAVVVLGGGVYRDHGGGFWPSRASVLRSSAGVALAAQSGATLVVTGGVVYRGEPSEAAVVAERYALPPDAVLEHASRTTAENARYVAEIATARGWRRVALVTDATHLRRSVGSFRRAGLEVAYARAVEPIWPPAARDFAPSPDGFGVFRHAVDVYAGLVLYAVRGDIAPAGLFAALPPTRQLVLAERVRLD